MTEPLRPMSTGQLMDRTMALYRRNFLLFTGIASVGPAAGVVFQLITVGSRVVPAAGRHANAPRFGLSLLMGWIILLAGLAIAHAGTVRAVAGVHLDQQISIVGAFRALRGRIARVMGVFFLATLISAIPAFVALIALAFALVLTSPTIMSGRLSWVAIAVIGIGGVASFLAVYVRYALAIQACVVENLGVRDSLGRSAQLSKGSRWRTAAIYTVFAALSYIAVYGLRYLAMRIGAPLHSRTATLTLIYAAGFLSGTVTGPLVTIGISLLYYDERVRKEAFDLQLMMLSLEASPTSAAVPVQI